MPHRSRASRELVASMLVLLAAVPAGAQAVRQGGLVLAGGMPLPAIPGTPAVATLNTPFTTTSGKVAFTGSAGTPATHFVWLDNQVLWHSAQAPVPFVLSGAEDTMGATDAGQFLYSPSISTGEAGEDGAWSHAGAVIRGTDPAPGIAGKFIKAVARPSMTDGPVGWFVATLSDSPGGVTTGRAFYRWTPAGGLTPIFRTGDVIFPPPDDYPVQFTPPTIAFSYDISRNGLHHIHAVGLVTGTVLTDSYLYVDGQPAQREGDLIPGSPYGDAWQNYTGLTINDSGTWAVAGTTTITNIRNYLGWMGQLIIRERDIVAGEFLQDPAFCQGVSINNFGSIAYAWQYGTPVAKKSLFLFVPDQANTIVGRHCVLASTGDGLDVTGDTLPDYTIVEINIAAGGTSQGLDLADDGFVYANLTLRAVGGTTNIPAIVRFVASCGSACDPDLNQDGNVDQGDVDYLINVIGGGDNPSGIDPDFSGDGNADQGDVDALLNVVAGGACP